MIIDQNLVIYEGGAQTCESDPIALNSLQIPGKASPIIISLKVTEKLVGATALELVLQQSDKEDGTFSDITGTELEFVPADFIPGYKSGWRYLPRTVTKPWIRLKMTATGTASSGKLFVGVMGYEDEPYEDGQYINKGVVVG